MHKFPREKPVKQSKNVILHQICILKGHAEITIHCPWKTCEHFNHYSQGMLDA